jgi:hypothetical protein
MQRDCRVIDWVGEVCGHATLVPISRARDVILPSFATREQLRTRRSGSACQVGHARADDDN